MTRGARWILVLVVVGGALAVSAGPRVAAAGAADPQQSSDLATAINDYTNAQVDAAMVEADAVIAQAVQAPTVSGGTGSPPSSPQPPPPTTALDVQAPVTAGPVEITASVTGQPASPEALVPVVPSGILSSPATARPRHDLGAMTPPRKSAVRTKTRVVSHATILHVDVRTSTSAQWSSSSSSARSVAESSVRSSVRSSTSGGGRSQRPAPPKVPRPFPPFPPNAPAPNSGATQTGGSGGQGALLIFFVALAALVLFGIHRLLRKVHWSNLRMPRRGAVLPWRPG
jgi:hypothetical protein